MARSWPGSPCTAPTAQPGLGCGPCTRRGGVGWGGIAAWAGVAVAPGDASAGLPEAWQQAGAGWSTARQAQWAHGTFTLHPRAHATATAPHPAASPGLRIQAASCPCSPLTLQPIRDRPSGAWSGDHPGQQSRQRGLSVCAPSPPPPPRRRAQPPRRRSLRGRGR